MSDTSHCNIIGLGPTSKYWNREGFSIGVNDCFRIHPTDYLIVVNTFKDESRAKIIQDSRPKYLFSYLSFWASHPCYKYIGDFNAWMGKLRRGNLYYSNNSTFMAASMAFNMGFKEIVLWGVDFVGHQGINNEKRVRDDGPTTLEKALNDFQEFAQEAEKQNCRLYLGHTGSLLNLPLWKSPTYS